MHLIVRCILPEYWNNVQLSGHNGGVILIDIDMKFTILRLVHLLEKYITQKISESSENLSVDSGVLEGFIKKCLQNLHVLQCQDSEKLVISLHNLENVLSNDPNITAIMIDSISSFYWVDRMNGGDSIPQQEANMKMAAEVLTKIIKTYNLVVFASKNAVFKKKGQENFGEERLDFTQDKSWLMEDLELQHAEFMCRAWQVLVSHRLVLVKEEPNNRIEDQKQSFVIGGDCVHGNKRFYISSAGIDFM